MLETLTNQLIREWLVSTTKIFFNEVTIFMVLAAGRLFAHSELACSGP